MFLNTEDPELEEHSTIKDIWRPFPSSVPSFCICGHFTAWESLPIFLFVPRKIFEIKRKISRHISIDLDTDAPKFSFLGRISNIWHYNMILLPAMCTLKNLQLNYKKEQNFLQRFKYDCNFVLFNIHKYL